MSLEKIYWDSVCFLGYLKEEKGKVEKCDDVLRRADRGEVLIVTSALTLTEVLHVRNKPRLPKENAELVRKCFQREQIRICNVSRKIAENAQDVVWNFDVRPRDAIHVATAIHMKVDALETFDGELIKKNQKIGNSPLTIREPQAEKQPAFDLQAPST